MTSETIIQGFDPAAPGSDRTVKSLRMGGQSVELLDWNELSRRGLLERINREILHPLGLAVCRDVESGNSPGALVSPDGAWRYPEQKAQPTDAQLDEMRRNGLSIDGDNAYKRDLLDVVVGALALGKQGVIPPPSDHWALPFWEMAAAEAESMERLLREARRDA